MFICQLQDSGNILKLDDFEFSFFNYQIMANLPQKAKEIVGFLQDE